MGVCLVEASSSGSFGRRREHSYVGVCMTSGTYTYVRTYLIRLVYSLCAVLVSWLLGFLLAFLALLSIYMMSQDEDQDRSR